jgi:hypothetical protein
MTRFLCLLFFCFIISCSNRNNIPSGILSKNEMQNVLWDMIQADQFSKQYILKDSLKKNISTENIKLYDQVFQIHHITKDEFRKSYQFYISRPDILKVLFDSLSSQAERRMNEVHQSSPLPKKPKLLHEN